MELDELFEKAVEYKASDIYLTSGFPATLRVDDQLFRASERLLDEEQIVDLMRKMLNEDQIDEFQSTLELNTAIEWRDSRFRVNVYKQQQRTAMVIRRINTEIPTIKALGLPEVFEKLAMQKRGLVLVVGQTGCGKSTSLAAMIDHRNRNGTGHIITIEDPIEYVHRHRNCIVSQRDIGIDTYSFGMALKNALRQNPDVILIGEIRDRETMEHAINFSETGHLCLATLHSNNASQAIDRIINFFPEEMHSQVLLNLALNMKGILAQRLVPNTRDKRSLVVEILLNEGVIKDMIHEGRIREIRDIMTKSEGIGMQTFDSALLQLYRENIVDKDVALSVADNPSNLRLNMKQLEMSGEIAAVSLDQDMRFTVGDSQTGF